MLAVGVSGSHDCHCAKSITDADAAGHGSVGAAMPGRESRDAVRGEVARRHFHETVAQARRELDRLAEEARRAGDVRAPVDGQVLTVRVHVIHGREGTAVLRVLHRKGIRADHPE